MSTSLSPQHGRAILLLSVAAFASSASTRLCDPMLPELMRLFAASPTETAHVVSGFSVAYGLFQIFYGPLGDRVGKYRLIALAALVSTLGSLGAALAASLDGLVFARFMTGISAAGVIPLSMAWIGDTVPYENRQATLARFLGGQIMGVIGGQFIGGLFADTLGWRWAFAFLSLVYLVIGALVLRESCRNPVTFHHRSASGPAAGVLAQITAVLRKPWARVILSIVFLEGMVVFGALAFVPSYLHQHFGLSLTVAGGMVGLFGVGGLSYIVLAKFFVRRLGERGLAFCGGLLIACGWAVLAMAPVWAWSLLANGVLGLGFYMLHNTLQTNATQMAPEVRGTAVSLFASAFFLGQSLGVVLAALLLDAWGALSVFLTAAFFMPLLGVLFSALLHARQSKASAPA
jgi:YNFM family putative membrane transporter